MREKCHLGLVKRTSSLVWGTDENTVYIFLSLNESRQITDNCGAKNIQSMLLMMTYELSSSTNGERVDDIT